MDKRIFGDNLRSLRESQKDKALTTQKGFADYIGVSQATLSGYENGDKIPSLETAVDIANKCGVSLDLLCGITTKKENPTYKDAIEAIDFIVENLKSKIIFSYEYTDPYATEKELTAVIPIQKDWVVIDYLSQRDKVKDALYSGSLDKNTTDEIFNTWLEKQNEKLSDWPIGWEDPDYEVLPF